MSNHQIPTGHRIPSGIGILLLLLCNSVSAAAERYTFIVTDRHGAPLADAAILLGRSSDITTTPAAIAVMDQIDFSFVPRLLVIQRGQQVSFPNSDNIRHHVYSFSPAKSFEIKLYAGTPEAPLLFDQPGIVVLGCNIHDRMVGYIVVADTPFAGRSNTAGQLTVETNRPMASLRIWHPLMSQANTTTADMAPVTMAMPAANSNQHRVIQLDVEPLPPAEPNSFQSRFGR